MPRSALHIAAYRLRATFRQRRGAYLALTLLVGLVGGIAMASVTAARRTQSSFPTYLASTNPSSFVATLSAQDGQADASKAAIQADIARIPGVRAIRSYVQLNGAVERPDGGPDLASFGTVDRYGSVDGLLFDQDRVTVLHGRMPDPQRRDEMVATPAAARILDLHLGQTRTWDFITFAQANAPDFDPNHITPALRVRVKVVGLVLFHDALVQDDVDRLPTAVVFTPALTAAQPRDWAVGGPSFTYYGIQLTRGADVARIEDAINALTPPGAGFNFHVTSRITTKVERAVKPESIALGVFGCIAAIATLLIGGQLVSRTVQASDQDRQVLRALGAGPLATAADGVILLMGAAVVGGLTAVAMAVVLSPLAPVGPARRVYPGRGLATDWTVLGPGVVVLVVALALVSFAVAVWRAPHRLVHRDESRAPSRILRAATTPGLPAPAMVGARLALEPGRGRTAVPVRSALLGSVLTVVMVVATLTFGASLRTLVSHPPLYGWNWSYVISGNPWVPPQTRAMLASDRRVATWSSINVSGVLIDGQDVPALLGDPKADPAPPTLTGHGLERVDQIVLGPATLAQLHKHVGDTVTASLGAGSHTPPRPYRVVGTATMPAIGQPIAQQDHSSMGIGALLPIDFFPASLRNQIQHGPDDTLSGPGMVLIRMRTGVSAADGLADVRRIVGATNRIIDALPRSEAVGDDVVLQTVQHPAEIVNYRNLGTTPAVLDAGLAAGAVIALGLTLATSVRRRRRDLALLKTFGFSTGQLAATIASQASTAVAIGVVVGIPAGIALGRWSWTLFAHNIYVVARPAAPAGPIALVGVAALVLANLVAALPGQVAARTPTALLLRAE